MLFLSDIVRKEGSIVARSTDNCLLCRIMENVKVSVPLDFSALTAEGCANWSSAFGVSERCGFARLHVSSEPGGNLRLWRAPCRPHFDWSWSSSSRTGKELKQWSPGTKLPPCDLFCVSLGCAYQLFSVLGCCVGIPSAQVQLHLGSVFQKSSYDASDLRLALVAMKLLCSWTTITEDCLGLWWLYARHSV